MTDIAIEGGNEFKLIKVEVGDDKEWKAAYGIDVVPDFGVFVNNEYYHFNGRKEAGFFNSLLVICSDLLQFVANRTHDGIVRVNHMDQLPFLQENGNVMMVGLFDEAVDISQFLYCRVKQR